MDKKDLQSFIHFFTHNKNLTRVQRLKRDELLARDVSMSSNKNEDAASISDYNTNEQMEVAEGKQQDNNNEPIIHTTLKHRSGVPSEIEYISPKNLQNFLKDFNQDDVLKYTCHLLDTFEAINYICKECKTEKYDYFQHIKLIKKHFRNLTWRYNKNNIRLSPNMITLISVYLTDADFNGRKTDENDQKLLWSGNEIETTWACEEIVHWAENNPSIIPNPGDNLATKQKNSGYRLPRRFRSKIAGTPIKTFSELTIFFKSLFHIRYDNSLRTILDIVNKQWKSEDVHVSYTDNFNNSIELLTDVDKLIQAYKKIIDLCIKCRNNYEEPIQIMLYFYDDTETDSTYFVIHHINTVYKKTSKNSTERIGDKHSDIISNQINGLCDLYIEAEFGDGQCGRINLWDKNEKFEYTSIPNEIQGVKYILKF